MKKSIITILTLLVLNIALYAVSTTAQGATPQCVGIGTTTPTAALDVHGNVIIQEGTLQVGAQNTASEGAEIMMTKAPSSGADWFFDVYTDSAGPRLRWHNGGTEKMSLTDSGNLKVSGNLEVTGTITGTGTGTTGTSSDSATLVVRHAQGKGMTAIDTEMTSKGYTKLWDGYSYLGAYDEEGFGIGTIQDLGSTGSCLKEFRKATYLRCINGNKCEYTTPYDFSLWLYGGTISETLTSTDSLPYTLVDATFALDSSKISKCAVYSASKPVVVVHSQSSSFPTAPPGYPTKLWQGYSFQAASNVPHGGSSTDLGSTGSCLQVWSPTVMVECDLGLLTCGVGTAYDWTYWLTARDITADEGEKSITGGSTIGDYANVDVSKCAVFTK